MRIEIPELKRCCCCLPLRRGLLVWTYLKQVIEVLLILYFIGSLISISRRRDIFPYVIVTTALILLVMDIAFGIFFLISAHRKNHEHMKLYYKYSIVILVLEVIALVGLTGLEIYVGVISMPYSIFMLNFMIESLCFVFAQIVLQGYFVILVRSEVRKLERSATFEFTNHSSEPQCKAQIVL